MLTFMPGKFEPSQYGPGDPAYLQRGQGKSIVYIGSTWTQPEHYAQLVTWNWRRKPPDERGPQEESDS